MNSKNIDKIIGWLKEISVFDLVVLGPTISLVIVLAIFIVLTAKMAQVKTAIEDLKVLVSAQKEQKEVVSLLPRLPLEIEFTDRRIPLEGEIRERVEQEFYYYLLTRKDWLILYPKRMARYFPLIEEELERADLPLDLKFVVLAESGLEPDALSYQNALGIWQLMPKTAEGLGLKVDQWVDERLDPIRSTKAAIKLFKELYNRFGDWFLVLAAYNWNPRELERTIEKQGERDYFKMCFNKETEEYIPRILALKIIFSDLQGYGIDLQKEDYYQLPEFEEILVNINDWVNISEIAEEIDSNFREVKLLNPWIKNNRLPVGHYWFRIPKKESKTILFDDSVY